MSRTYSQLYAATNSKLQKAGGTITTSDFLAGVNLALDGLLLEIEPPELQRTQALSPALFKDVVLYTPPTDLQGDSIIDIRPLVEIPNRSINNNWEKNTTVEFEANLIGDKVPQKWTIEYNNGQRYLRVLSDVNGLTQNVQVDSCDSYNGNGTWTADATTDALNVATNTVNYFEGSGSVSFDVSVAQSANNYATIYNPSIATLDISGLTSPYLFFYVYIPNVTYVSSISFVLGSDTGATPSTKANYKTFTATTQFDGSAFVSGRNLIGIAYSAGVDTGTFVNTTLKYEELKVTYSASQADMSGVLLDGVYLREGMLYEIRYLSQNAVVSASGTRKQYFTADDDTLAFNAEGELTFVEYVSGYLAPNVKDVQTGELYGNRAARYIAQYNFRYPKQRRVTKRNWYFSSSWN